MNYFNPIMFHFLGLALAAPVYANGGNESVQSPLETSKAYELAKVSYENNDCLGTNLYLNIFIEDNKRFLDNNREVFDKIKSVIEYCNSKTANIEFHAHCNPGEISKLGGDVRDGVCY